MADLNVKVDIGDGGTQASQSSSDSGIGMPSSKSIKGGVKGALKGLGIATALAVIADIVLGFKPLVNVVSKILKMISMLLHPIAQAIMTLLMPVLMMLKPLVRAVNELIRPFIILSTKQFKEGDVGGGIATLIGGISVVIIKLLSEVVKFIGTVAISLVAELFGFVSEEAKNALFNKLLPAFYALVDNMGALMSQSIVIGVASISENSLPEATDEFLEQATNAILKYYPNISEEVRKRINEAKELAIDGFFVDAMDSIRDGFVDAFAQFAKEGSEAIRDAFRQMINAVGGSPALEGMETFEEKTNIDLSKAFRTSMLFGIPFGMAGTNIVGQGLSEHVRSDAPGNPIEKAWNYINPF